MLCLLSHTGTQCSESEAISDIHSWCAVALLVVWYTSGVGYLMSVLLPPQSSLTAAVAAVMVLGGFFNGVQPRLRSLTPFTKHALGRACLLVVWRRCLL